MSEPRGIRAAVADSTAIVGIGVTEFAKHGGIKDRSEFALCCEAIAKAAEDAGIDVSEIDGFCSYAAERHEPVLIQQTLGIPELRFSNMVWGAGGGGCSGAVMNAALAVHAGICRNVVVYRSLCQGQYERYGQYRARPTGGAYMAPFGLMTPAQMVALTFRRHMHRYGTPAEALGHVAVTFREHAQRNPAALQYDKPLTLTEHAGARRIADPFGLYDCCLETDGAGALIVTSREHARDLKQRPVRILAAAQASGPGWGLGPTGSHNMPVDDYHTTNSRALGKALFGMAGISPSDLDCAQIYDAFSGLAIMALEDFGVCEPGEAAHFIMAGNLSWERKGRLPSNTAGGLLSEGYLQGLNLVLEGVRQMRGTSTAQVDGAETCLVTSGGALAHKSALILAN
ncbi:MAG TPA: acetyl-CoA acetyltransferase [Rhizobiaceae bacterium]|nr:acetyl-CoA acetyltransferase [Rhizobiaceae bacterium]